MKLKFDELDSKMRIFETSRDYCIMPELFIVARLDGRNFTTLTKEKHKFKAPFDEIFRDYMVETTKHLMNCGFKVEYAYTESDEISLLFNINENSFSRKERKLISILSGEASAKFTSLINDVSVFDCRISELPNINRVVDYFRWRNEDAHRNSLNAHCYWMLRNIGDSPGKATNKLKKLSVSEKNELLFKNGINYNELPNWQKRGIGLYWEEYEKDGFNPITKDSKVVKRKKITIDYNLKKKEEYSNFISNICIKMMDT